MRTKSSLAVGSSCECVCMHICYCKPATLGRFMHTKDSLAVVCMLFISMKRATIVLCGMQKLLSFLSLYMYIYIYIYIHT